MMHGAIIISSSFFACMKVSGLKNDTVKICNPLSWFIFTYDCFSLYVNTCNNMSNGNELTSLNTQLTVVTYHICL